VGSDAQRGGLISGGRAIFGANMNWSSTGAILLALAVIIGAFGAHALQGRLDAYSKGVYETGVIYHFFHALGLLVVSFLPRIGALTAPRANWVCALLLAGVVLFSGSLYALAISGVRMLGAVTPFGGLAFIAAWVLLAYWLLTANA
jgi:uncharacterized membrane protein YgdD (TMEM256/DUF423 family)